MADITFNCPICNAEIEADETLCGGVANCPSCNSNIAIPMPGMSKGMKIAGFVLERRLGAGGMGEVWLATQTAMDRQVALKILSPALTKDANFVNRFLTEVKNSAKLDHPNIITAHDAGVESGIYYLAISFVDGVELGDRLKIDNVLGEKEALRIVRDLAEALRYAWNKYKILHRDIKPANIMIALDGTTKLMDMGISKSLDSAPSMTMTGTIMGTPLYMSPEQAVGDENIDFRSDIYSLGATLYHIVTGSAPYDATTPMGIITKHVTEQLPPPRDRNPELSEQCAAFIEIMMAKDKNKRQKSWENVIEDIDLVLDGQFPVTQRPEANQSTVMQMTPSQFLKKQKNSKAYPAKMHSKTTIMTPDEIQSSNVAECNVRRPLSFILTYLLLIAVIASAGYYLYSQVFKSKPSAGYLTFEKNGKNSQENSAPAASAAQNIPQEKESKEEKNQREIWDFAVNFMVENPEELDQSISNFSDIKSKLGNTKYKMMADVELNKLNKLKKTAIASVLDTLRSQAKNCAEKNEFGKAINICMNYSGKYVKDTTEERARIAEEISQQAAAFKDEKKKEILETEKKKNELLATIFAELLKDDVNDAQKLISASELKNNLGSTEKNIAELANINKTIMESFAEDLNKDIEIETDKGPIKTKVKKIKDNTIYIEEKMAKGFVQKALSLKDLSPKEKAKRIAGRVSKETEALCKVLNGIKFKNYQLVEKNLGDTGSFAPVIAQYMNTVSTERLEQSAEKRLKELLQKYKLPQDIPLNLKAMPIEIRKQMLPDKQIKIFQDELSDYRKNYENSKFFNENKQGILVLNEILDRIIEHRKSRTFMKDKPDNENPQQVASAGTDNRKDAPIPKTPEEFNAHLKSGNPDYKGNAKIQMAFNRIAGVDLSSCPEVKDLVPLKGMKLNSLIIDSPELADLKPLEKMPLVQLFIKANVEDLSPLKGMPLKNLHVESKNLTDISALENMPLENLYISGEIGDIAPLKGMKLNRLFIGNARASDISVLEGMPLKQLYLPEGVTDIEVLKNMPLEELMMPNSRISDISALKRMPLKRLDITCTNVSDISPLQGMPLRELNMGGCDALTDISPVLECKNLEKLVLPKNIENIQALKKISSLKFIGYNWPPQPAADFWAGLNK